MLSNLDRIAAEAAAQHHLEVFGEDTKGESVEGTESTESTGTAIGSWLNTDPEKSFRY